MKTCFVIGPMNPNHLPKLHWLADDVVAAILKDRGFKVFTPDVNEIGNIMDHVIRSADRAELVVADTTGNNPNVLYEIAILDALNRPCVPVKQLRDDADEEGEKSLANHIQPNDTMAFDRAQYRYFCFREYATNQAIEILKPVIESVLERKEKLELQQNPLTNFYRAPLSSMAPTRAIVEGYFNNFISPALQGKIIKGPAFCKGSSNLPLEIVIPRLHHASRTWIEDLIKQKLIHPVTIAAPGREVNAFVWDPRFCTDEQPVMVDVPTTLAQLTTNVGMRMGMDSPDETTQDYQFLEQDESQQFVAYLKRKIAENKTDKAVATRLKVVKVDESRKPDLFAAP